MTAPNRPETPGTPRGDDLQALRSDTERTRARLGATVEALGAQLNPSHLAQRAKDGLREATIGRVQHMASQTRERISEGGRSVAETIRENPVPAALAAAGIGWLLLKGRDRHDQPRYMDGEEIGRTVNHDRGSRMRDMKEGVAERMHDVTEKARETGQRLSDKAESVTTEVRHRSRKAADRVGHEFEENPLALGGIAIALGLAVGMSLPRTRREVELMGDKRDELMEKAREQVSATTEKVEGVVEKVIPEVKAVVREAAREEGLIR